ncbi:ornithine cyclodeaminase [Sulfolobales archaeon HS-7]|nr:ornithine cyclodeaminase [Sulfolobales archaeon HS-7]
MKYFSAEELHTIITPEIAVEASKEAFSKYSSGDIKSADRQVLYVEGNWWGVMTAFDKSYFITKIVNVIENSTPPINSLIVLFSAISGKPIAVFDGNVITGYRTAGASVLSVEMCWGKKVDLLGIIGAGTQAKYHAKLALSYLQVDRLFYASRREHPEFEREFGAERYELPKLLSSSQVILSLTSTKSPVILGKYLKDDFHAVSIGAHTPDAREIDDDALLKVKTFVVDAVDAVSKESGDYIYGLSKGLIRNVAEIGKLRNGVERPSLFKSVGIATQDLALVKKAYEIGA